MTPSIPGATLALTAAASKRDGSGALVTKVGLAPDQSDWSLQIREAPELVSPPDQGLEIGKATQFSWRAPGRGFYLLHILSQERTEYLIATSAPALTLAELSSVGIALRPATTYLWRLISSSDFSDVDQAARDSALATSLRTPDYPTRDSRYEFTSVRQFTTSASP